MAGLVASDSTSIFRYLWAHASAYIEAKGAELDDFKHRWSITAFYTNFNGEAKQPDSVSVTTAAPEWADVVIGLAESGCVKAIGTSYLCSGLPQKLESLVSSISPSH